MPEAIANQTSIHYEITGSGPPLLLLHRLGSSGGDWEKQIDQFSDDYTVITIDFRGHGQSEKPPGSYSVQVFADDIAVVLREIDLAPVAVAELVIVNALPEFELETFGRRLQIVPTERPEQFNKVLADFLSG
jgi:3-oxoadipate enol-lactonase